MTMARRKVPAKPAAMPKGKKPGIVIMIGIGKPKKAPMKGKRK